MDKDEHVYYWAWQEKDNPGHSYFDRCNPKWYRVFKSNSFPVHDDPVTEPMSRDEAIEYCERIIKLTGGRSL